MSATHLIANLIGAMALLLWGIHMVQSGVLRVFGTDMRSIVGKGLQNRLRAFLAGLGVTAVLQSSTATAMLTTSFSANGALELVPALAVMLGANVGTSLIVQVLSFDITLAFPVLIAAGVFAFRRGRGTRWQDLGRVAIGLGLMLLSLHLLTQAIRPTQDSATVRAVLAALTEDPVLTLAIAAGLTWVAHSSVAIVLLVMSLASSGLLGGEAMLAMVLGANVGAALNPVLEGAGGDPAKLRVPIGNLAMRVIGALLALPILGPIVALFAPTGVDPGQFAANFHTGFNLAMAALFIGLLPGLARILVRVIPPRPAPADPARPLYLDPSAVSTPTVALANAAREVLRIVDVIETMLAGTREAIHGDDRHRIAETSRLDNVVDRLHEAVQRYLSAIYCETLSDQDARRLMEVQAFALNLEHIGDIIDKNLTELAAKRLRLKLRLSAEGLAEIDAMYAQVLDHLRLAVAIFMSQDLGAARRLIAEKERFREMERVSTERHFRRVRDGRVGSIETSGLHLDVVRDLKRIEAHIAATAHPLLERTGALKSTRLASVSG